MSAFRGVRAGNAGRRESRNLKDGRLVSGASRGSMWGLWEAGRTGRIRRKRAHRECPSNQVYSRGGWAAVHE